MSECIKSLSLYIPEYIKTCSNNHLRYLRNLQYTEGQCMFTSGSSFQPELLSFTHNYPAVTIKIWCNPCTLQPARQLHLTSAWPKSATTSGSGICHTSSHLSRHITLKKKKNECQGPGQSKTSKNALALTHHRGNLLWELSQKEWRE